MSFIYKITNKINEKSYIGKTDKSLEKRFNEHVSEAKNLRHKNRPLYKAMNKYGIESFYIELLEETEYPEEREIFWIKYFNSYGRTGYNATKGGDGRSYIDLDRVIDCLFENELDHIKAAKQLGHDRSTVVKVAEKLGIFIPIGPRSGVDHPDCLLTEQDVQNIRSLYIPKKRGRRKIAKMLNLSEDAVDGVIRNRSWKIYGSVAERPIAEGC